jgi:hypothetical protein
MLPPSSLYSGPGYTDGFGSDITTAQIKQCLFKYQNRQYAQRDYTHTYHFLTIMASKCATPPPPFANTLLYSHCKVTQHSPQKCYRYSSSLSPTQASNFSVV